jgi:hypothetical protein
MPWSSGSSPGWLPAQWSVHAGFRRSASGGRTSGYSLLRNQKNTSGKIPPWQDQLIQTRSNDDVPALRCRMHINQSKVICPNQQELLARHRRRRVATNALLHGAFHLTTLLFHGEAKCQRSVVPPMRSAEKAAPARRAELRGRISGTASGDAGVGIIDPCPPSLLIVLKGRVFNRTGVISKRIKPLNTVYISLKLL